MPFAGWFEGLAGGMFVAGNVSFVQIGHEDGAGATGLFFDVNVGALEVGLVGFDGFDFVAV